MTTSSTQRAAAAAALTHVEIAGRIIRAIPEDLDYLYLPLRNEGVAICLRRWRARADNQAVELTDRKIHQRQWEAVRGAISRLGLEADIIAAGTPA